MTRASLSPPTLSVTPGLKFGEATRPGKGSSDLTKCKGSSPNPAWMQINSARHLARLHWSNNMNVTLWHQHAFDNSPVLVLSNDYRLSLGVSPALVELRDLMEMEVTDVQAAA